jgi:hypothetical protein
VVRLLIDVDYDEAAMEHTFQEEAFRTFGSSFPPFLGLLEIVKRTDAMDVLAAAAAVMPENGLSS